MTTVIAERTFVPSASGVDELHTASEFLAAHDVWGAPQYCLRSADGQQAVLPEEVHQMLMQAVGVMQSGRAVTVAPQKLSLTTQEAADLLGVSRPTVVKLIDQGEIPCVRNSTRRQILLSDLRSYRERRKAAQYAAIQASGADLYDEDDPAEVIRDLKEARRVIAERRRG